MSIGTELRTQDIIGGGDPIAEQDNNALCPISTTLVVGACVIIGNPVGKLSAVTQIIHVIKLPFDNIRFQMYCAKIVSKNYFEI